MFTSTTNLPERLGDPNHNCLASPPDQILTFCNSPDCLKPLCLECLAYHCMVHFQKGNQPILLEFKRLKENCTERLNKVGDYLGDLLTAIKKDQDSIPGNWGYHDIEAEKIRRSKEYLINYIEKYYKDLLDHYYLTSKPLETKLGRLYEEIKDLKVKLEENTSSSSSEVIKKVFDRNFEQEIAEIRKNFPGKNVIINDKSTWTCRNNIKVEVDYSKLYTSMKDELQKYTSIIYQPACQESKASVFKKFTKSPANVFEDFKSAPMDSSAFLPRALSISKNSIYKGLAQDKPMFTRALEIKQLMESFKNGLVDIPKQMMNLQPILDMNNTGQKFFEQQEEKPHENTFGVKEISSDDSIPNRAAITISHHKSPEVYCIADDSSSASFEVQELGDLALKQEAYKLEATHAAMLIEKSLEMSLRGSDFKKAAMNKAGKKSSKGVVKQEEKENLSSRMCSLDMPVAVKKRIIDGVKENMMPGRELKVLDVEVKKDGMDDFSNVSSVKVKSSNKRIALRQIQNFPTMTGGGGMEEEEDEKLSLVSAMKGGNMEKSPFRIEDITPIKPIMNTEMKENMFITPNDPILRMMQGEKTNEQSKKKLLEENNIPAERMHLRISFTEEPEEKKLPKQEEVVKKRIEIILEDEDDDVVEEIPTEMVYKKMLPKQEAGLDEKNMVKLKPMGYGDDSNLLEQGRLEQLLENDFGDDPIEEAVVSSREGTDQKEEKKVKREEKAAVKKEPQPLRRSQRKKKSLDQTSLTMEDEDCFKEVLNLMNASSKTKKEESETTMMRSSRRQQQSKVKKEEDSVILRTPEKKSTRRKKKDTGTKTKKEESETTTFSTNLASSENLEKKNSIGVANHNSMHSEEVPKTPMEEEKGPEEPENVYTPTCLSPISRFEASMTPRYYMIEGQEDPERGTRSAIKTVDRSFDMITPDFAVNVQDYFQSDCKNKLLHFFQWRSKNLHIISISSLDIIQRGAPFQTIALDINFEIPDYHNSLITPTGDIYLTGGQDAKNAGQKYNNVYMVSFEKNTLIPKANMLYRRDSHALCYFNGCLYALGGITVDQNGKKNVTNKCEKYVIAEDRWEEIAELNLPVCNHSASVFQDKYIFCFGGRLQPNKLSNNIFRYNLEKNAWLRLELKPTLQTQARLSLTSQAACFQINDKQIFVFGGYQANRNISSQSFLFEYCSATNDYSELKPATPLSKMDQSASNIGGGNKRKDEEKRGSGKRAPRKKEAMNIKRRKDVCIIKGLSKKDLPYPAPFWDKQVIADDGKIYCLQNVTMSNNPKLSYSTTRRLLVFNGNEWTSLN